MTSGIQTITLVTYGSLAINHPYPFSFYTIEDALDFVENVLDEDIDLQTDRIVIYQVEKASYTQPGPIRATVMWQFSGDIWVDEGDDISSRYPQGKLPGHTMTYYEELLDFYGPPIDIIGVYLAAKNETAEEDSEPDEQEVVY